MKLLGVIILSFGFFVLSPIAVQANCSEKYKLCNNECEKTADQPHKKLVCKTQCSVSYAGCDVGSFIPGLNYFFGEKEE